MSYLLWVLIFLFFAGISMTTNEGLWSNTITLLCLIISGLSGVVGGVPLGMMVFEKSGKGADFAWYFVFAGIWLVFSITMLILRILTDKASKVRVRFFPIIDKLGGWAMSMAVASMLQAFAAFTLLVGPIAAGEWDAEKNPSAFVRMGLASIPFAVTLATFTSADDISFPLFDEELPD